MGVDFWVVKHFGFFFFFPLDVYVSIMLVFFFFFGGIVAVRRLEIVFWVLCLQINFGIFRKKKKTKQNKKQILRF